MVATERFGERVEDDGVALQAHDALIGVTPDDVNEIDVASLHGCSQVSGEGQPYMPHVCPSRNDYPLAGQRRGAV